MAWKKFNNPMNSRWPTCWPSLRSNKKFATPLFWRIGPWERICLLAEQVALGTISRWMEWITKPFQWTKNEWEDAFALHDVLIHSDCIHLLGRPTGESLGWTASEENLLLREKVGLKSTENVQQVMFLGEEIAIWYQLIPVATMLYIYIDIIYIYIYV